MKTHTFSIVIGTEACNAKCPFCVSKMTCRSVRRQEINWKRFDIACRVVLQARDGLVNVILTGTGEPTLWQQDIFDTLNHLGGRFPLVTLQTNGTRLAEDNLKMWSGHGLTGVCISVTHYEAGRSNEIMGISGDFNFWRAAEMIQDAGLMVRLNCTMLKEGIHQEPQVVDFIDLCRNYGIDQLTFREVDSPDCVPCAETDYVAAQKPHGAAESLFHYLAFKGAKRLPDLPHGGVVFDDNGQNVCISNCLTDTLDPNDIRQIIFFPDGKIGYDWKYKGARIL